MSSSLLVPACLPAAPLPPPPRPRLRRYPLPFVQEAMLRCIERRGQRWSFFDAREVPRIFSRQKHACFLPPADLSPYEQWLDVPLHTLAERLAPLGFVRVHRGELINLRFLRAVVRVRRASRSTEIELHDGQRVAVSRRYVARLRKALEALLS